MTVVILLFSNFVVAIFCAILFVRLCYINFTSVGNHLLLLATFVGNKKIVIKIRPTWFNNNVILFGTICLINIIIRVYTLIRLVCTRK